MLVAESRIFQVVTFGMLHLHHSELDQKWLLLDGMAIADEADAQLNGSGTQLDSPGDAHPGGAPAFDCNKCRGFQSSLT